MIYLGLDVLDAPYHNMREAIATAFPRAGTLLDPQTGKRTFDDHAAGPSPVRNFQWTAIDRASCVALRAFLDARHGRLVPFWVPTFCHDLELAVDVNPGTLSFFSIRSIGYTDRLFPNPARKYIAVLPRGGTLQLRKITGANVSSSTTETLSMDAPAGSIWLASSTVISFLTLCRLSDDLTPIKWWRPDLAEATLRFQELPTEVPA